MTNYHIRYNYPEIEYTHTKASYEFTQTGLDFIDKDYWSGVPFE